MHKELEIKFRERWPEWFRDLYGDPKVTCMDLGFTHDDGWFDLVWGLCEAIEALGPDEDFKVEQVKEKFGGLMFYVSGGNDAIQEAIFAAGTRSLHICEVCGQLGTIRKDRSWIRTLCDHHAANRPKFVPTGAADNLHLSSSVRALIHSYENIEKLTESE
jgi:hypothetical protein